METQSFDSSKSNIKLNLDEFDIDAYDFKPVTKGLGFHEEKEKKVRPNANNSLNGGKIHRPTRTAMTPKSSQATHLQNIPATVSDPGLMSGVEAIYQKEKPVENKVKETVKAKPALKEASFFLMASAFILDFAVITSIALLLFASFYIFAAKSFDVVLFTSFIKSSIGFVLTMAALIYLTYFSLLEPVGTLGKRTLGLGTFQLGSKKRVTIKNSFLRALISLFSLPLLTFPLLFDFQGKLSDSKVLKLKK